MVRVRGVAGPPRGVDHGVLDLRGVRSALDAQHALAQPGRENQPLPPFARVCVTWLGLGLGLGLGLDFGLGLGLGFGLGLGLRLGLGLGLGLGLVF